MTQAGAGLGDQEAQEVLGHAATNTELDLTAIPKFIEAKETGKRSAASGLNRISDYQRGRSNTLPSRTPPGQAPRRKLWLVWYYWPWPET